MSNQFLVAYLVVCEYVTSPTQMKHQNLSGHFAKFCIVLAQTSDACQVWTSK